VILAALLLSANRRASVDRLIEATWGAEPPTTAEHALQVYISKLRRAFEVVGEPDRIEHVPDGYQIVVQPGEVDVDSFRELASDGFEAASAGDQLGAAAAFDEALGCWRGAPLSDLAYEDVAQHAIRELDGLRLDVVEARAEAGLALGRNADVARDLRDEVARDPSREGLVTALMLALYRTGRQSEATELFQRHREYLAEELGLDPSPVVTEVHDRLLRHELDSAVVGSRDWIPRPSTPLIGRDNELALAISMLEEGARLLTLTGPGGVGKTRLAIEVVSALSTGSSKGVFVDLASVQRPDDVLPAIASAFTIPEDANEPLEDRLARHLDSRRAVVVLDNFEHLDAAAADIGVLVARTRAPRFIVTSRIRLRLSGEYVMPVAPLKVDTPGDPSGLETPAVALFVQRARAADPSFQLDEVAANAVTEVCRRLDGLPLAIELAAARVDVLSPSRILALVDEDANVLTSRSRNVPDRHRSLTAALSWSIAALSDRERLCLFRLAVAPGVFDLEIADAVGGELTSSTMETVELLSDLVDRSLVGRTAASDGDELFIILQTVRAFALADAGDDVDLAGARRRFVSSVASFSMRADEGLRASQQEEWLARMHDRRSAIRGALSIALEDDLWDEAARIIATASRYWCMSGTVSEGRTWAERVLEHVDDVTSVLRVPLTNACARLAEYQSDFDLAEQLHRRALEATSEGEMVAERIDALSGLAVLSLWRGDPASSIASSEHALQLASDAADDWRRQHVLGNLAGAHYLSGDVTGAKEELLEALRINTEIGNLQGRSTMLANLSVIAIEERRYDDAAKFADEAKTVAAKLGDVNRLAAAASNAGLAWTMLEHLDQAGSSLAVAMELSLREHDHRVLSSCIDATALLASRSRREKDAATLYGAAAALNETLQLSVPEGVETEREDDIRDLRSRLGDAFDIAWEAGRTAELSVVVDLARSIHDGAGEQTSKSTARSQPQGRDHTSP
jgi:predicted ATPase/DNA-binding SARP family transcriptional activator